MIYSGYLIQKNNWVTFNVNWPSFSTHKPAIKPLAYTS